MTPTIYFCSAPQSEEREKIATHCWLQWRKLGVDIKKLTPRVLGCTDFDFQKLRRACAEAMAKESIYILTDDDCDPLTDFNIGIECLRQHPDFAIVSAWPVNASIHRWTPVDYEPFEDLDVMEHVSTGGIRICRRNCMIKGWPDQVGPGYDKEHGEALRASGYRVGYSQHFRMNHLGEGKTTVWKERVAQNAG